MNSKTDEPRPPAAAFSSVALDRCPDPDYVDLYAMTLPDSAPDDPAWWARRAFTAAGLPVWARVALGLRQVLVPLIGVRPSPRDTMAVDEVVGNEALITASERHLDFWCAIGIDPAARLVRVTTVVRLHGWRGRAYWSVVRLAHPIVTTAIMRRLLERAGSTPRP
ncbi:MAG: DUF2867 domain-containing protein [Kineosporiaceae bacterium]|nr:DUF2867 domain-containing protein [Kineosporiaceae bacterium]MBK8077204.1 DUF2867 domain-containing protein [Kineosporiaceae bacterium]